jgi:hypothetical protein
MRVVITRCYGSTAGLTVAACRRVEAKWGNGGGGIKSTRRHLHIRVVILCQVYRHPRRPYLLLVNSCCNTPLAPLAAHPRMPKHVPSFKHLIATSHSRGPDKRPEKSVNDLLTSSRTGQQQQHAAAASSSSSLGPLGRETPPHLRHGERVWVPSPGTAGDGGGGGLGLVDVQEGAVHP